MIDILSGSAGTQVNSASQVLIEIFLIRIVLLSTLIHADANIHDKNWVIYFFIILTMHNLTDC